MVISAMSIDHAEVKTNLVKTREVITDYALTANLIMDLHFSQY